MTNHEHYMRRCIELARNAEGYTSPNPMVGCVIVHQGKIIGEGYHHQAGEPHAEVNAIRSVCDPELLKASTLYVNLEPCSHWGKTPPCADLIISHGIPHVVVGMVDPFPEVSGNGIRKLREAGIRMETGILEDECRELNRRFITYNTLKRPYITLKWAQTADGYLDNNRPAEVPATWMTGPVAKILVHRLRAESDAILTGTHTIRRDNPSLTVRESGGKNPLRIVLDRSISLPAEATVFNGSTPTVVLTDPHKVRQATVRYPHCQTAGVIFAGGWKSILQELYLRKIQSVFVEGGAQILHSLIEEELWDEAYLFISPMQVTDLSGGLTLPPLGVKAPEIPPGTIIRRKTIGGVDLYSLKRKTHES